MCAVIQTRNQPFRLILVPGPITTAELLPYQARVDIRVVIYVYTVVSSGESAGRAKCHFLAFVHTCSKTAVLQVGFKVRNSVLVL